VAALDANFGQRGLSDAPEEARRFESAGFDGLWTLENVHDPFLPIAAAIPTTEHCLLGTGIAVALARSPMTVALQSHDLQSASGGRFALGLGSQVKPHIERRFSMPWSHPAARMREYVLALRAIWSAWNDHEPLSFRGDFYTHTLMTPAFSPAPSEFGPPPVHLAAVGAAMVRVAGEVADGLICHPLLSTSYLEGRILPAIVEGRERAGAAREFTVNASALVATGSEGEELESAVAAVRSQVAFYGSTPAYEPVLADAGRAELHRRLHSLSREGRWDAMGDAVDDDTLELFAVVGGPREIRDAVERRYGKLADRVTLSTPYPISLDTLAAVAAD
jgi:probable F420-dependent oxidoreductase